MRSRCSCCYVSLLQGAQQRSTSGPELTRRPVSWRPPYRHALQLTPSLQGIPLGLTFGTLPFLLKQHLSYSQLAVFALSTWPYSLKLLWSPIVDAWFLPRWGRRKSWIVPVQAVVGVGLWMIGGRVQGWLDEVRAMKWRWMCEGKLIGKEEVDINFITLVFGSLILAAATQGEHIRAMSAIRQLTHRHRRGRSA